MGMALPMMTTATDVMDIVNYLAAKPNGASITDAFTSLPRDLMEDRKLNAFQYWGVIKIAGDVLILDELGKDLNMIAPENRYLVFQKLIHTTKLYKLAVDWMFQNGFNEVTNIEVASFWHMKYKSDVGSSDENIMKSMATCFLQICEAANFGSSSPGKMSKTTHFKIDRSHLGNYYRDTSHIFERELKAAATGAPAPSAPPEPVMPMQPEGTVRDVIKEFDEAQLKEERVQKVRPTPAPTRVPAQAPAPAPTRGASNVFLSPSLNRALVEQVRGMLEMEKLPYSTASNGEVSSVLDLVNMSATMQKCSAGVVIVSSDESLPAEGGRYRINPNKLLEIGAALAIFSGKVLLVWDEKVEMPTVLQGLETIKYSGREITFDAGASIMTAIKRFNM
jgi:hypothetical protein